MKGKLKILTILLLCAVQAVGQELTRYDNYCELASNHNLEDNFSQAILYYDSAIALNPTGLRAYYGKAGVYRQLEDFDEVLINYEKIIEIDSDADLFFQRGVLREALNDAIGAIQDFTRAIELDSTRIFYYIERAEAKMILKDNRGAIIDYSKYISFLQKHNSVYPFFGKSLPESLVSRALAKTSLSDYQGAIRDCDDAILLSDKYAHAYHIRGYAKVKIGQDNEGCLDLSRAGELGADGAYGFISEYCN
ncbi:MAG: hypothetical protein RIF36_10500 [Imperialibacter sp.]|uniref:tetratricopeptide repeat protein n=1 Tax=Imperialibacter sp. TaxID=2038411 RepID=UPI0032EDFD1A